IDDLYEIADDLSHEEGLLLEVVGDGGERSKRTRLGKALGRQRDRVFGGFRIVDDGEDGRGRRRYRLEQVGDAADIGQTSSTTSATTSAQKSDDIFDL